MKVIQLNSSNNFLKVVHSEKRKETNTFLQVIHRNYSSFQLIKN